jgi:protein-S-isoprenylcysteine O-methyltransferase Ste14
VVVKYIVGSIALILFSFSVFRVVVRKDYLKKDKLSPTSYILETLIFGLHANSLYLFFPVSWPNLPPLPDNDLLVFCSMIIIIIGLIILTIAFLNLGVGPSFGLDKNKLKSRGIYLYSRNPQLFGYGLMIIGFVLLYSSWYSLGWFLTYLIIAHFMIKSEEEFLELKYQEEFIEYCKAVPRIIRLFRFDNRQKYN